MYTRCNLCTRGVILVCKIGYKTTQPQKNQTQYTNIRTYHADDDRYGLSCWWYVLTWYRYNIGVAIFVYYWHLWLLMCLCHYALWWCLVPMIHSLLFIVGVGYVDHILIFTVVTLILYLAIWAIDTAIYDTHVHLICVCLQWC